MRCHQVRINIEARSMWSQTKRSDNRDIVEIDHTYHQACIDPVDLTSQTETVVSDMCLNHVAIRTTQANGVSPHLRCQGNQFLIDLATQDHLHHFQCLRVRHAHALLKARRDVQLLQPGRDSWASTMDEHNLYPQVMQPDQILQHSLLVFQSTPT